MQQSGLGASFEMMRMLEQSQVGAVARLAQSTAAGKFVRVLENSAMGQLIREWENSSSAALARAATTIFPVKIEHSLASSEVIRAWQRLTKIVPLEQFKKYESIAANAALADFMRDEAWSNLLTNALEKIRNPDQDQAPKSAAEWAYGLAKQTITAHSRNEEGAAPQPSLSDQPVQGQGKRSMTAKEAFTAIVLFFGFIASLCTILDTVLKYATTTEQAAVVSQQFLDRIEDLVESPEFTESLGSASVCWNVGERVVVLRELPGSKRSRAVGVLKPGQEVVVTGTIGKWARVIAVPSFDEVADIKEGWALKKYFQTVCGKRSSPKSPMFDLLDT